MTFLMCNIRVVRVTKLQVKKMDGWMNKWMDGWMNYI